MIPKEKIEEIRTKTDIVKVVSEYVTLKKRGKNYLGSCPFHSEKDPSFTVSPDKQIFHCFGCNEGGNVFSFLMKIENISFIEAVADLGTKLGITLPEINPGGPTRNEKDQLYQIMQLAIKFYGQSLNETTTKHLKDRGLSEATIKTFQLGFAPDSWDNLFKHLISRGVSPVLANKAGLILPREGKDSYYDRFRNRLIIPIFDQRGRAIAIGGRSIGNQELKYLNSPE
ncbi:MAG: hypothetical protein KJ811_00995 [Candidatus Margulisbacteria bacterium]|nr:hypothetical protein [Candidatus Margulisiibacteriota bacterium]